MGKKIIFTAFLVATLSMNPTWAKAQKPNLSQQEAPVIVIIEDDKGGLSVSWMTPEEWARLERQAQRPPRLKKTKPKSKNKPRTQAR